MEDAGMPQKKHKPEEIVAKLSPFVSDPLFTQEKMASKSSAAANLCAWVVNIYKYNRIYVKVKPLMDALNEAQENKAAAEAQLKGVQDKVAEVEAGLKALQDTANHAERLAKAVSARNELREALIAAVPEEYINAPAVVGDLIGEFAEVEIREALPNSLRGVIVAS